MNYIFRGVTRSIKSKSFYKIFSSHITSIKSSKEAGTRLKGRLIEMLLKRHGGVAGVRKAFLRWAVVINPNLVRNSISKLAICSRIRPICAIWRMKKLIEKSIKVRLPEAVIRARYTEALHFLDVFIKLKRKDDVIISFNKIRPGLTGRLLRLLISILNRKAANELISKEKTLNRLRDYNNKINSVIKRLVKTVQDKN